MDPLPSLGISRLWSLQTETLIFLLLTTCIPIFLGLPHSCTVSTDNPSSSDSNSLDFQQSKASRDPVPVNNTLEAHGFLCCSKETQLEKQLEGPLPQLWAFTKNTDVSSSPVQDYELDIAVMSESHLNHLQD